MLQASLEINRRQRLLGVFISLVVIGGLMIAAYDAYAPAMNIAKTIHIVGNPFLQKRLEASLFYAQVGRWPRDDAQVEKLASGRWMQATDPGEKKFIEHVRMENGAIHIEMTDGVGYHRISMRPAVPVSDPMGPVIWVCGTGRDAKKWHVFGPDRTDADRRFIPKTLY